MMSDDSSELICLDQDESDDTDETMSINEHNGGDPEELIRSNGLDSADSGESINLNEHDIVDTEESIGLNLISEDRQETMRLNEYYSDLRYSLKMQARKDITFTTSAVGLIELSNVLYSKLCEVSLLFAECVSSSMFIYYVTQLYYMRLCVLEWSINKPEAHNLRINSMILQNNWIVPQLLAAYFNSIGSFKDSAGIPAHHREIAFPCSDEIEGINGFFGRVDENTHSLYENRISPGVVARRIVEDLIFTLNPLHLSYLKGFWDLPQMLVPAEENAGGPTANLLGWSFATALSREQVNVLKICGISVDQGTITFPHCTQFCHNNQLMSYISAQLKGLRGKVKCVDRLNTTPLGSVLQQDYQLVGSYDSLPRPRYYVYGDSGAYNLGFEPLQIRQELLAHVFRLRIYRRKMLQSDKTVNPWCCYDFQSYTKVPKSWSKTRNLYFLFGGLKTWDVGFYKTQPANLEVILKKLVEEILISQLNIRTFLE